MVRESTFLSFIYCLYAKEAFKDASVLERLCGYGNMRWWQWIDPLSASETLYLAVGTLDWFYLTS
jgi:hypothetical protein